MAFHRFFIPPAWLTPPTVSLQGETARQIQTVLRLQPGDEIIVLDNSGLEWQVRLTDLRKGEIHGQIVGQRAALNEPKLALTLYQGLLKAEKFEWVLQKGTELGVSRFVPTLCQRSVAGPGGEHKQARWERIIREAAEQSRRGKLPTLEPAIPLAAAIEQAGQTTQSAPLLVMPWEEAAGLSLKMTLTTAHPSDVGVFIGPEGGFTPTEAALAHAAGIRLVTLGPRILRAETAAVAVCAVIMYQADEWISTDA
ncbi:MAG: 16S rRNA (uracil(1498)-N(3))-methyltransferase [Anaerolineales bacterium]|nr:16S rRNA (uracil(1498)-N(3))-methyltransferase [Anaerolineales bacterium]